VRSFQRGGIAYAIVGAIDVGVEDLLCDRCVRSMCDRCVRSMCDRCAIGVRSVCDRCAIDVRSMCDRCPIGTQFFRGHSGFQGLLMYVIATSTPPCKTMLSLRANL